MIKLEDIEYNVSETGESLDWKDIEGIRRVENSEKVKRLYYLLEFDKDKLSTDDLIILMKLEKRPTSVNSIKLNFSDDGYFTCKRNINIVRELNKYTKSFLYSISHMITHDGRLKYGNNRIVPSMQKLKAYLDIANEEWNKYIKPDINKFNIMVKEKIDNRWCILLNPIFATTTRTFSETMFLAFHKDLKKYLYPLEYMYLKKFYEIEVD